MTRVEFYFNVANKQKLLLSLVEHALIKHKKVTILSSDNAHARNISAYLWQDKPNSFLPNLMANAQNANNTPIVIVCEKNENFHEDAIFQDDLLINLSTHQPKFFSRFTHMVELVGMDDADKVAARQRYKFYRDRGYEIKNNDHAKLEESVLNREHLV